MGAKGRKGRSGSMGAKGGEAWGGGGGSGGGDTGGGAEAELPLTESQWNQIKKILNIPKRHIDVLRCLIEGLSRQQTARKLRLEVSSVKTYHERMYKKLNIHDKGGLLKPVLLAVLKVVSGES